MIDTVYDSAYCKESLDTILSWDYDSFLEMYNRVLYKSDIEMAAELDAKRAADRQEDMQKAMSGRF